MQSTFSKRNTFGARTECPSYKQSNKGIRERRCSFYRDTRLTENSVTVLYQRQKMGHPNLEKSLHGNKKIISRIMRTPPYDQSLLLSS